MNPFEPIRRFYQALTFSIQVTVGFNLDDTRLPGVLDSGADDLQAEDFMEDPRICEGCGMSVDTEGRVEGEDTDGNICYFHPDCSPLDLTDLEDIDDEDTE